MRDNLSRLIRLFGLIFIDCAIIACAFYLAHYLRLDAMDNAGRRHWELWTYFLMPLLLIRTLVNLSFGIVRWSFKLSGLHEAVRVCLACVTGSIVFVGLVYFWEPMDPLPPRSVYALESLLTMVGLMAYRFGPRYLASHGVLRRLWGKKGKINERVLIYGANQNGLLIQRMVKALPNQSRIVFGYIDEDKSLTGTTIDGCRVFGGLTEIEHLISKYNIRSIYYAEHPAKQKTLTLLRQTCKENNLRLRFAEELLSQYSGEDFLSSSDQEKGDVQVPFAVVKCSRMEYTNVTRVLDSGWLTMGPYALEFEREFADTVHTEYALAVNSCTAALHLAAEAVGVGQGDTVLVPTMTFTASAEVIRYLGADPVPVDVEYGTALITPDGLEQAIRKHEKVKAVVVVHFGGQAANMLGNETQQGIMDICQKHGVRIIEDAAHAFPARHGGKMIGSIGDVSCFSFYANKTITTGEGGMLTTNDPDIAKRASVMRLHGIDRDAWDRYSSAAKKPGWEYDIVAPGFKYNMPDTAAAIGLGQLARAEDMRCQRERVAMQYQQELSDIDCMDLPVIKCDPSEHAWHLFPIVLHEDAPVTRNRLIDMLWERGIRVSVHYKPLHRMTYYRDTYRLKESDYPNAERIWQGCLSLPIYPSMTEGMVEVVCSALTSILR